ncbi:MAG: phage integrase SAM-like domain-containing protein [Cyclobacteriaceae bacterium]
MTTKIIVKNDKEGLPRKNREGKTILYIQYQHDQKSTLFSAIKIEPDKIEYAERNGKLIPVDPYIRNNIKGKSAMHKQLMDQRRHIEDIARELVTENIDPAIDLVRQRYNERRKGNADEVRPTNESLQEIFEKFKDSCRGLDWKAEGTERQYNSMMKALNDYEEELNVSLSIGSFNIKFYDSFLEVSSRLGRSKSTIGNHIKSLKKFLGWAEERDYKVHNDYKKSAFKKIQRSNEIIYLTKVELQKLIDHDFTQNQRLDRVRDLFVFNSHVGLRVGDLMRFSKTDIQEETSDGLIRRSIRLRQGKTEKYNYIPLASKVAYRILEKYDFELPRISPEKYNKYIKDACSEAEINASKFGAKHELISSHTAIKTFISHCAASGVHPKSIADITGKSVQVILDHYMGTDPETVWNDMERAFGDE